MPKQVPSVKVGSALFDTGIPTADLNAEIRKAWIALGKPIA